MINKHRLIIAGIIFLIMISGVFINHKTKTQDHTGSALADWQDHFESVTALINSADLIIKGKVVDSYPEQRVDMIFTKEVIEVEKVYCGETQEGDKIEILQTGGELNNIRTDAFAEAPLLDRNDYYLLFLQITPAGYYLIMGGYQGVGKISNNKVLFNVKEDQIARELENKDLSDIEELILSKE